MSPADASKKFGSVVRSLREARDIGLRELAARIGISPTYLSQIERGEDLYPREEVVVSIANEVGIGTDELLSLAGFVPHDVMVIYARWPRLYGELIRATRKMPKSQLEFLVQSVRESRQGGSPSRAVSWKRVERDGKKGGGGGQEGGGGGFLSA